MVGVPAYGLLLSDSQVVPQCKPCGTQCDVRLSQDLLFVGQFAPKPSNFGLCSLGSCQRVAEVDIDELRTEVGSVRMGR
jgi:hypothetical protein